MLGTVLGGVSVILLGALGWLYTPDKPRAALQAQYATPPSTFVEVAGIRLHVRDSGPRAAPAVILLHGFGSSLQTWDDWATALEHDFRVVRYDQPGFGLTGTDPSGDYSDTRATAILAGLMDHLGVQKATILGHSMGGRIAWTFASTHPERVEKLVLMAPDGFASPGMAYGMKPSVPLMMRALPYVLPMPMLRASLKPGFGDPTALTEPLVERYRDMMLAPGVRTAIVDRMAQMVLVNPEPMLARIGAPTLLMWGGQDGMVPATNAADYLRNIKGARLISFPALGHLLQEERPAETVAALQAFLKP